MPASHNVKCDTWADWQFRFKFQLRASSRCCGIATPVGWPLRLFVIVLHFRIVVWLHRLESFVQLWYRYPSLIRRCVHLLLVHRVRAFQVVPSPFCHLQNPVGSSCHLHFAVYFSVALSSRYLLLVHGRLFTSHTRLYIQTLHFWLSS